MHFKLGTQVDAFAWNERCDVLATIAEERLSVWYCPAAAYVDRDLLK
jgi:hypothetical protein